MLETPDYGLPLPLYVDFSEGGKPEYPVKNLRSTGEINFPTLLTWSKPENSVRTGLTIGERQRANRIRHPCSMTSNSLHHTLTYWSLLQF